MSDVAKPAVEAETIRRCATEQVQISLSPSEIDAVKTLLGDLLEEIHQIKQSDRRSVEPESGVVVQEWPT